AVNQHGEEIELTLKHINPPKIKDVLIFRFPFYVVKLLIMLLPKSLQGKILALDIFESIRPTTDKSEKGNDSEDPKKTIRKKELSKKKTAKKAAQRLAEASQFDNDMEDVNSGSEDEETIAARRAEEEIAAARRRRRMKAPGQAAMKAGRRG